MSTTHHPAYPLLRHLARHYSDWHMTNELDAVLATAGDPETRRIVEKYATLRRQAPGWNPRSYEGSRRHSTHDPSMFALALEGQGRVRCRVCNAPFEPKRRDARTCSDRCRGRASRGTEGECLPPED
jgi:hypothetical protein